VAALAAALVDLPAQDGKQVGRLLDLIENDQLVAMLGQIEFRLGDLARSSRSSRSR